MPRVRARLFALAAVAVLATGCAYFNTFYHAQKYYNKAEQAQRESKSDKLAPDAVRNYDLAIEKAAKVIFDHGGGWRAGIDDALYLQGQCYYGKRDYETAVKKFNEIVLNFPESDHVSEALFYTGLCYHHLRNYATARRLFERVLRTYPDFKRRDEIVLTLAQGLDAAGETKQALIQYRSLVEMFDESDKRIDALKRVGQIHYEAGRFDSALAAYEQLAQIARVDADYFEAQLNVGSCLVRLGEADRALSIYRRILPEDQQSEDAGRAALAMAEAENRRGKYEAAIEHLTRVSTDFVNRTLGIEADFRLGYAYEIYQQRYDLARPAYEKAARAQTQSVFKDQAARRLANLKHLEELQAAAGEAELQQDGRAEAALKVAEFSFFESGEPEKAIDQYQLVEEEFPGTEFAPRAAYARAWIYQTRLDSLATAAALYDSLVARYPASAQAEQALVHLKELGYPEARRAALEALSRGARDRQRQVDDSLAAIQAAADSLVAKAAAAAEAATRARADSLARVQRVGARSRVAFEAASKARAALEGVAALAGTERARLDSLAASLAPPAAVAGAESLAAAGAESLVAAGAESLAAAGAESLAAAGAESLAAAGAESLAAAGADSLVVPDAGSRVGTGAERPAVVDAEAEAALARERAASAARITAARAEADSVRGWAEAIVDSVAQVQAQQDAVRSAAAETRADSLRLNEARADSLADKLGAERRSARGQRSGPRRPGGATGTASAVGDSAQVPTAADSSLGPAPDGPPAAPDQAPPPESAPRDSTQAPLPESAPRDSTQAPPPESAPPDPSQAPPPDSSRALEPPQDLPVPQPEKP